MKRREFVAGLGGTVARPLAGILGDDGRFDFYVAMNGGNDWHDLECPGRRLK